MSNPNANPPTQQEILQRQSVILDGMEAQGAILHKFMNGSAAETIVTESGVRPTLAGVIDAVLETSGARRYEVAYFVEDLTRYANGVEPLLRAIHSVAVELDSNLLGSYFKLATPSPQPIELTVRWGDEEFPIRFAPNATDGVITVQTFEGVKTFPAGTMVTLKLDSPSWTAKGLVLVIVGRVAPPAVQA